MYTERELPFLVGRSKPVLSATYPFASVFGTQTSRPPSENTFTLSGSKIGAGLPLIIGIVAVLMFFGRR